MARSRSILTLIHLLIPFVLTHKKLTFEILTPKLSNSSENRIQPLRESDTDSHFYCILAVFITLLCIAIFVTSILYIYNLYLTYREEIVVRLIAYRQRLFMTDTEL